MKKITLFTALINIVLLTGCSSSTNKIQEKNVNDFAPYPKANSGYTRSVIYLPEIKNEENAKVELMVGKTMQVDCNIHHLTGTLKKKELVGWGYQYYVIENAGNGISTKMACPADSATDQFVTIINDWDLIRYNSLLPIVVYTPSDLSVKYRIWSTNQPESNARIE